LLESVDYIPYIRNGCLIVPVNRNFVLGPYEKKSIKLHLEFMPGQLQHVYDATHWTRIRFHVKTNGRHIWGVIENISDSPAHVTPKADLCTIHTSATHMELPDLGIREIPHSRKAVVCRALCDTRMDLVSRFSELFGATLGCCKNHTVKNIPFKSGVNVKQMKKPASLGAAEEELVWCEVQELLKAGVVEEVEDEPNIIPAFTVGKKNGSRRLVLDFRRLNSYIQREPYVRTNKEHVVSSIKSFKIGSSLDLCSAFHQIQVDEKIKKYFGFTVKGRLYVFKRLPFGYVNSSFEFLRAIHKTVNKIQKKIGSQLVCYADDLLLLSDDISQHKRDLETTLSILQGDGWRLKAEKCTLFQESFDFLGFQLSSSGWTPNQQSLKQLLETPMPQGKTQWRRLRGWMNQLTRFIHRGSCAMEALQKCEKSSDVNDWRKFLMFLEQHMVRCSHPVAGEDFTIGVDASSSGWGACLIQGNKIVCCCSGTWEKSMKHHRSNVLEIEGLVRALNRLRPFVYGRSISVYTDNAATFSLANPENQSDFIRRRLDAIQGFSPAVKFLPGKTNVVPDFLSRIPQLMAAQVSGESSIRDLLSYGHQGHFGVKKTMDRIKAVGGNVSWLEVKNHVRKCEICQKFRRRMKRLPFGVLERATDVKQAASVDFIGPLPTSVSGVKYIFTYVDHLSRFAVATPSRKSDMKTATRILGQIFDTHGKPSMLLCDAGSYFTSPKFAAFLKERGVTLRLAPPHSHHSNGLNEKFNGNLVERLRRMTAQEGVSKVKKWVKYLQPAVSIINSTKHGVTGFEPAFLWCGGSRNDAVTKEVNEARKVAVRNFDKARDFANKRIHVPFSSSSALFPVGCLVWVFDHTTNERHDRKLNEKWKGPFRVTKVLSNHRREVLNKDNRKSVYHVDSLNYYYD